MSQRHVVLQLIFTLLVHSSEGERIFLRNPSITPHTQVLFNTQNRFVRSGQEKLLRYGRSGKTSQIHLKRNDNESIKNDNLLMSEGKGKENPQMYERIRLGLGLGGYDEIFAEKYDKPEKSSIPKYGTNDNISKNEKLASFGTRKINKALRYRRSSSEKIIRFGRSTPEKILRYGRSNPEKMLRYGRSNPEKMLRYGRSNPEKMLRYGRSNPEEGNGRSTSEKIKYGRGEQGKIYEFKRDIPMNVFQYKEESPYKILKLEQGMETLHKAPEGYGDSYLQEGMNQNMPQLLQQEHFLREIPVMKCLHTHTIKEEHNLPSEEHLRHKSMGEKYLLPMTWGEKHLTQEIPGEEHGIAGTQDEVPLFQGIPYEGHQFQEVPEREPMLPRRKELERLLEDEISEDKPTFEDILEEKHHLQGTTTEEHFLPGTIRDDPLITEEHYPPRILGGEHPLQQTLEREHLLAHMLGEEHLHRSTRSDDAPLLRYGRNGGRNRRRRRRCSEIEHSVQTDLTRSK